MDSPNLFDSHGLNANFIIWNKWCPDQINIKYQTSFIHSCVPELVYRLSTKSKLK